MREILFRGKRVDNGEWVQGSFCPKNSRGDVPCIIVYNGEKAGYWYEVYPATVGQYTGVKDKNGKRIFEGDTIKIPDDYDEFGINAGEIYEVYFAYGGFRLKPKYAAARGYWLEDDNTVEVIGNIHDNRENNE